MQIIVGAAILDGAGPGAGRRVLAAERAAPVELAGWWEFPGGKVEPGESCPVALRRECREELGVEVELGRRLGADVPVGSGAAVLRVWTARIVTGTPVALEHRSLRWLPVGELFDVAWLPADLPLVRELQDLLSA